MTFNLYSAITLLLAASALAVDIGTPAPGQNLVKGQRFVVQLNFPAETLVAVRHVSVAIGLQTCGTAQCPDIRDTDLGQHVLFTGSYDPQHHEDSLSTIYQNYTLTLDNDVPVGNAKIKVAHFGLTLPARSTLAALTMSQVDVTISA